MDLEYVSNRVQQHLCRKKKSDTGCIPLKACCMKSARQKAYGRKDKFEADSPVTHLRTDRHVLVWRGEAKRSQRRISGHKNAFGSMVGR